MTCARTYAITCEECKEIEKSRREAQAEVTEKNKELDSAFAKKEFMKIKETRERITELRKKILEWQKSSAECAEACRPDLVKGEECRKIKVEIEKKESEPSLSEEQIRNVDDLYRSLLQCNKELRKLQRLGD
jgi:hypothetical protein